MDLQMFQKQSNVPLLLFWWSVIGFVTVDNSAQSTIDCSTIAGAQQPRNLINSKYYLLSNGSLCCPAKDCQYSDYDMRELCGDKGVVKEPCYHCFTCGKVKGESCHGNQFRHGQCRSGLGCININGTVLEFQYDEGVCTNEGGRPSNLSPGQSCGGKFNFYGTCEPQSRCYLDHGRDSGKCAKYARTKTLNQECGGAYGVLGRCRKGLRCTANEDEFLDGVSITGLCFHSGTPVCFKDCSSRARVQVCGDNGKWYENICYLRQSNCGLSPGQRRVRRTRQQSTCYQKNTSQMSANELNSLLSLFDM